MRGFTKLTFALALVTLCAASTFATTKYVVDNDDNPTANSATFYTVGTNGKLTGYGGGIDLKDKLITWERGIRSGVTATS